MYPIKWELASPKGYILSSTSIIFIPFISKSLFFNSCSDFLIVLSGTNVSCLTYVADKLFFIVFVDKSNNCATFSISCSFVSSFIFPGTNPIWEAVCFPARIVPFLSIILPLPASIVSTLTLYSSFSSGKISDEDQSILYVSSVSSTK